MIRQQQANGALVMDYGGHGNATLISHESVLELSDFSESRTSNLPLWVTAACDIMAFDGVTETIGEAAVLTEKGEPLLSMERPVPFSHPPTNTSTMLS